MIDIERHSTMKSLLKTTGYVLRFQRAITKKPRNTESLVLLAEEIQSAEEAWIKDTQSESLSREIK